MVSLQRARWHMRSVMRTPPPPLDRFIETLWYWEGDPVGHAKDTILASARMGLTINLADDRLAWYDGEDFSTSHDLRGIGISGPYAGAFAIDAFHAKKMGVQFRPGGAWPFFGAAAFANRHVALEDVCGAEAGRLHHRLVEARTVAAKFEILQQAFLVKLSSGSEHDPAIRHALQCFTRAPHRVDIAAVTRETGLSRKRFIQVFTEQVGFRPKLYLRVARFQRALRQIAQAPHVDWGDVVERNGYYDQSHFIRDFGQFSGLSPRQYWKRRGLHLQHVPIPA